MRRIVLTAGTALSMLVLSGCMVIDCEEYGPPEHVCVVPVHPHPMIEVVHVPGPGPRRHHYHGHPRRRH